MEKALSAPSTFHGRPGEPLAGDVDVVEEGISQGAPYPPPEGHTGIRGGLRRATGTVEGALRRVPFVGASRARMLLALLVAVIVIAAALMLRGGGGFGGGGSGPQYVDRWGTDGLAELTADGADEGAANIEGQTATYLERLNPGQREVFLVTKVTCTVEWTDEGAPPTQVPVPGYTNDPDAFQLIIIPQGYAQPVESELVYNPEGGTGTITLNITFDPPVPIANPDGAEYLPRGANASWRVDLQVYTGDCGDWQPPFARFPQIGDGGNYYDFRWTVTYLVDSDGKP